MTKHTFTPGPWHIYGLPVQARILGPNGEAVAACRAKYRDDASAATRNANARLIAAAPELYEALHDMVHAFRDENEGQTDALAYARAALAKVDAP